MKSKIPVVLCLLGFAGIALLGFQANEGTVAGGVEGSIETRFDLNNTGQPTVLLPDISVFLRNIDTGNPLRETKTGSDGGYAIEDLPAGSYQLCWEAAGWVSGCQVDPIVLSNDTEYSHKYLDPIAILPEGQTIMGHVQLADGSACEYSNSEFDVQQSASVSALDAGGRVIRGPVTANDAGEYVLAGLPAEHLRVRATCANGSVEEPVTAVLLASGALDLTLNTVRPRLVAMTAQLGSQQVKSVLPGTTVELAAEAQANQADQLQYRWATDPGFGTIVSTGGNHARWTAPSGSATGQIRVLISNDHGGLTPAGIVMSVGKLEVGLAAAPDPAYCQQVVQNGMVAGHEYIPPYSSDLSKSTFLTRRKNAKGHSPTEYYGLVDPGDTYSTTLAGWWMKNGWDNNGKPQTGKTEARTVFLNNNDLGYVRDFHCIPGDLKPTDFPAVMGTVNVACWVTNYSKANQEIANVAAFPPTVNTATLQAAFTAAEDMVASKAEATVVMEYRKDTGLVTFFAYDKPPAGGKLGNAMRDGASDQDGFGKKDVPGMCNNCHGGVDYAGNADVRGNFIVFDLSTFLFPSNEPWRRMDKEGAFKQQNLAVLATKPRDAVQSLIKNWYGDDLKGGMAVEGAPAGWRGVTIVSGPPSLTSDKLYENVVRTCRTCHTADVETGRSWATYAQFKDAARDIARVACSPPAARIMPHDCISYLNFWRFMPPSAPAQFSPGPALIQPFMDMGAFLVANGVKSVGGKNIACENTKGQPPQ